MLKALIFDVDGTLAETEEAHRQAFNDTFDAAGIGWHWSRDDYAWLLGTTGGKERMQAYREHRQSGPDDARIADLHQIKTKRYAEIVSSGRLPLRPGVAALINSARASGMKVAVATTTNRPNVDVLARACWGRPAQEVFHVIAAGDEVSRKKPAPDVFRLALHRLDLPAEVCVAFEDSRNGLRSAMGAGLRTIVTPSAYTSSDDFSGAAEVLRDLTQWKLPLFSAS